MDDMLKESYNMNNSDKQNMIRACMHELEILELYVYITCMHELEILPFKTRTNDMMRGESC